MGPTRQSFLRSVTAVLIAAYLHLASPLPSSAQVHTPGGSPLRTVRVGIYQNPPKIYTDEAGRPAGIFIDLLSEIAIRERWTLVYVPGDWPSCLSDLERGRIDLLPDVAYSRERDERLDFHEIPALESWSQVYARPSASVTGLSDLGGRRVALLEGAIQNQGFQRMMDGFDFQVQILLCKSYEEAFLRTAEGKADVAVANHFFGDRSYRSYGLVKTPIVFDPATLFFATAQGRNAGLLKAVDRDLRDWKNDPDSPYYRILAKRMDRPPRPLVPGYVAWALAVAFSALLLAAGIILLLRFQVRLRTRNLEQAYGKLRESEKALGDKLREIEQVFATMPAALIYADIQRRIIRVNPAFVRVFGYSPEEVLGRNTEFLYERKEDYEEQGRLRFNPGAAPSDDPYEVRFRRKNGEVFTGEGVSAALRDGEGRKVTGLMSLIRDVTEIRRMESQLEQARKMESVARLASGVAHDFNNMLSVIINYTQMAMDRADPAQPLHAELSEVMAAAQKSADITRQLLALARMQGASPRTLDLNRTVEGMLGTLRGLVGEDIELVWAPAADPVRVRLDPGQFAQILSNLCVNARDAIADSGRIVVETRSTVLDGESCTGHPGCKPGSYGVLSVADNGRGMDRHTLEHLFEPFFTTKEIGRGTGLGLATVDDIVRQNGGFIDVHSRIGEGTVFSIYLPVRKDAVVEAPAVPADELPKSQGERVLLVEGESSVLNVCRMMLEKLGYGVLTAGTPKAALELAGKHAGEWQLLVADVIMPGMSGRELAERLKAHSPGLKVLFCSGYSAEVIAHRGWAGKDAHFIQKPFTLRDLAEKVREALDPG